MDVSGRIRRINGPLVEVEGLANVAMLDLVALGEGKLPGEVIAIDADVVTVQAYEPLGGIATGAPALAQGLPLFAALGPGLLGGIFDGLLRPLADAGDMILPRSLDVSGARSWPFEPRAERGSVLGPGALLGVVQTGVIEHRVLVPPGISGVLEEIAPAGTIADDGVVATLAGRSIGLVERWPIRRSRPVRSRLGAEAPLATGQRVIDMFFPIAKGATAAVPGGFGTGKTMLLQQILKWCDADVIVFVGCGERGNELADALADMRALTDPRTGRSLLERTVVIANTSNMPVMGREASIYAGMTVAEFYRDMGYDAVLLADSTSRWAEALREFSSRSGELPAEEGYPAGLSSALAAFYERAGSVMTLGARRGSVTAIGAVSPPGGDMTEPVTAHTERFVRCLWSLDRDLAYARHYPAVTWRRSFARDVDAIGAWHAAAGRPEWAHERARALGLLGDADRLESIVELVGVPALPARERMVLLAGRFLREGVLQQNALSDNDATCNAAKQSALLALVLAVYDRCTALVDGGVPAAVIEELDLARVARVRDETGPTDAAGVLAAQREILAALEKVA
ncbi:MAG: V-type ATP synthase subunit A [Candidatus Lustribacter sp.]|jgi:V/A-type H+-transporting ATPase subunit A